MTVTGGLIFATQISPLLNYALAWPLKFLIFMKPKNNTKKEKNCNRGHLGLNLGPLDLQSNALPLSYTPLDENN